MMTLYNICGIPFGWIMYGIYYLVNNYALAILIFTIVSKLILFPISYRQQVNTAKTQRLQPKLQKLQKKYGDDRQKLQEEQQKLYREEHVNPSASCLPMILQFVLLFGVMDAIYRPLTFILRMGDDLIDKAFAIVEEIAPDVASSGSGLREELSILQVHNTDPGAFADLFGNSIAEKMADFYNHFSLFGVELGITPTFHPDAWTASAVVLICIPFVSGILQLILTIYSQQVQKKRNPAQQRQNMGCMTVMLFVMPVFSVWFAFQVPAGVGFYWACSSFFSLVQTVGLNKWFTPERSERICEKEYQKKHKKYANGKRTLTERLTNTQSPSAQLRDENARKIKEMSRSELSQFNKDQINEARRRMAEKYGDTYDDTPDEDDSPDTTESPKKKK